MEPGSGSVAGVHRGLLQPLLHHPPLPPAGGGRGPGRVEYANGAAHQLAGGVFPTGRPEDRAERPLFQVTWPDGRPIPLDEMPSVRAARGERIEAVEVDWHTP